MKLFTSLLLPIFLSLSARAESPIMPEVAERLRILEAAVLTPSADATKLQGFDISTTDPMDGEILLYNATSTQWEPTAFSGSGTVTSVAQTVPSFLTIAGSPVTTSGTLAIGLANQNANLVFAGPATGGPAAPTFRSLAMADIPPGFANEALSNLVSTAVNASINPAADNAVTLGDVALRYSNLYAVHAKGLETLEGQAGQDMEMISGTTLFLGGADDIVQLYPYGTAAPSLQFADDDGSNFMAFKAPAALTASTTFTLPDGDGTSGQVLSTDGAGALSWASVSAPTGTANTLAFFNGSGALSSNATHGFVETSGSMKFGVGTLVSSANGTLAHGSTSGGTLTASGEGSQAHGSVPETGGSILASGIGSKAFGLSDANGGSSLIRAQDEGSVSFGRAITSATITSGDGIGGGSGALAFGMASLSGANVTSTGRGAMAHGEAAAAGTSISATASGAESSGQTTGGNISATGIGAKSMGSAVSGTITSTSNGSLARGAVSSSGSITASNNGSTAFGNATAGTMTASGNGSIVRGNLVGAGVMTASASGSHVAGATDLGTFTASSAGGMAAGGITGAGSIIASGTSGSLAMGGVTTATISATASGTMAHGVSQNSALLTATSSGAMARGNADTSGTINATNNGAISSGRSTSSGFLTASALGSLAMGDSTGGTVVASGTGSHSYGSAASAGELRASGTGSSASGIASGTDSLSSSRSTGSDVRGSALGGGFIDANGIGSVSYGEVDTLGGIDSSQSGSIARGKSLDEGSISVTAIGAHAYGSTNNTGSAILASADASEAGGTAITGGTITAAGAASKAFGVVSDSGSISSNQADLLFGTVDGSGSSIISTNPGGGNLLFGHAEGGSLIRSQGGPAIAFGYAINGDNIEVNCSGCYAGGLTTIGPVAVYGIGSIGHGDDIDAAARFSQTFGIGHANDSYGAMFIGQYSLSPGYSENTYVTTDPVFVIGNGADGSNRSNAMTVLKNGEIGIGRAPTSGWRVTAESGSGGYGFVQSNGTVSVGTAISGSDGWIGTISNHQLRIITNDSGGPRINLDPASGFIGVNNESAAAIFDIKAADNAEVLRLTAGGSYVGFKHPSGGYSSNEVYTLPATDGSAGQALLTDGSGVMSWSNPSTLAAHVVTTGSAPSITANCGTSPSVAGNDSVGRITVGTGGTDVSCTLTFASAWGTAPACTVQSEDQIIAIQSAASTTTLVVTTTAPFGAGDTLVYHCLGY